jgi:YbgC/YbaW family acyl-CoA thioester hydrolase
MSAPPSGQPLSRDALLQAPSGFSHELPIRFQDVDAAGIIFFARVLDYCHDAYVEFLRAAGCPLHQTLAAGEWIAPLVHAEADFIRPLRFGERVVVHLVAARQRGSVYTIGYRLQRPQDATVDQRPQDAAASSGQRPGEAVGVGQTVHVVVDRQRFTRIPLPEPLLRALATLTPL